MSKLTMALEAIDFQKSDFADQLTAVFEKLSQYNSYQEANESPEVSTIEKLVRDRIGLSIRLNIGNSSMASVSIPILNNNHVFIDPLFQGFRENNYNKNLQLMKDFKSSSFVDLKNAKVGGFFSTIEFAIDIGFKLFTYDKLSPREVTACFLHEIGHAFTQCEFFTRCVMTNQALACATRSLQEAKNDPTNSKHVYVVKELGRLVADNDNYFQDLTEVTDNKVVTTVIIGKTLQFNQSNMDTSYYDQTSCEAQADAFATRFGLGREVVTGLAKTHKMANYDEYRMSGNMLQLMGEFLTLVLTPISVILTLVVAGLGGVLLSTYFLVVGTLALYGKGTSAQDYSYDKLKVRFLRVKEQVITGMKNRNISNKEKKDLLESLDTIESKINELKDSPSLFRAIADYVFNSHKKAKMAIELQRNLEALTANDIYAKAAALSMVK